MKYKVSDKLEVIGDDLPHMPGSIVEITGISKNGKRFFCIDLEDDSEECYDFNDDNFILYEKAKPLTEFEMLDAIKYNIENDV